MMSEYFSTYGEATGTASTSHLVLIPSYNTGPRLVETVREALRHWKPVWVIVDGSTDGSHQPLRALANDNTHLRIIERPRNGGKGAAVLTGFEAAAKEGFTHALVMDADGQHSAPHIAAFMKESAAHPRALVLGKPLFGPEAPALRLNGRKLSVGMVHFETLGGGIDDPLFGFRVYPIMDTICVFRTTRWARRYDFDPEIAVRLFWSGVPTLNRDAPCRYLSKADGGISHFHYLRDNLRMIWLHTRLVVTLLLLRWPAARKAQRARRLQK